MLCPRHCATIITASRCKSAPRSKDQEWSWHSTVNNEDDRCRQPDFAKKQDKQVAMHPMSLVMNCGFVVSLNFSFLGATPDAKVCIDGAIGLIEVKCSFHDKDMTIIDAIRILKRFPLCEMNDEVVRVKTKEMFIERIFPDVTLHEDMLLKLTQFYCKSFLTLFQGL
ncbi:hypothetical protein CAPTEDRAFT_193438 [Capitella teleta]|uniref:YqaJ viral recombinase domain-containing protein n=1 Tax=Capitella teleta TaxID=283909 RepID=R7TU91_CAPTE|nr:hypothetical protein CAPTEDRAFT_193438 [Capitella teleta]|eukprot:ELT97478.1 hypothetical protein CAPTEDRAFT_193438 [Capitella teleta]